MRDGFETGHCSESHRCWLALQGGPRRTVTQSFVWILVDASAWFWWFFFLSTVFIQKLLWTLSWCQALCWIPAVPQEQLSPCSQKLTAWEVMGRRKCRLFQEEEVKWAPVSSAESRCKESSLRARLLFLETETLLHWEHPLLQNGNNKPTLQVFHEY